MQYAFVLNFARGSFNDFQLLGEKFIFLMEIIYEISRKGRLGLLFLSNVGSWIRK